MDGIILLIVCCPWILWVFIGGIFTFKYWGIITGIFNLCVLLFKLGIFVMILMAIFGFFSEKNKKADE